MTRWRWLAVLLSIVMILVGCSAKPTARAELERFQTEYKRIEPEIALLGDSFQTLMLARNQVLLNQMQLKAEAIGAEWSKLKFNNPEISELHFEVSMALHGIGHGYGLGYNRVLRGDRGEASEGAAIDASTEGLRHILAMHEKMMSVKSSLK